MTAVRSGPGRAVETGNRPRVPVLEGRAQVLRHESDAGRGFRIFAGEARENRVTQGDGCEWRNRPQLPRGTSRSRFPPLDLGPEHAEGKSGPSRWLHRVMLTVDGKEYTQALLVENDPKADPKAIITFDLRVPSEDDGKEEEEIVPLIPHEQGLKSMLTRNPGLLLSLCE